MTIDVENGRRWADMDLAGSADLADVILIRRNDGTGVKRLALSSLQELIAGDLTLLETEHKDDLVAAINDNAEGVADAAEKITMLETMLGGSGAGFHNSIYRGKSLGTALTEEQHAAIVAGTFDDMYIGDYWTIGGVVYRIADFDYFLRSGDTECTAHHVVVVPDTALYNEKMNDSNTTAGGYTGSKMYTTNLATAKTTIRNAFGTSHILTHREYHCNAVTNGKPSGGAWFDSDIELMSEAMVYGGSFFEPTSDGSTVPAKYSVACKQLNLFRFRPDMISNRTTYWLRNVVSATSFAHVASTGYADDYGASYSLGVRPAFCLI